MPQSSVLAAAPTYVVHLGILGDDSDDGPSFDDCNAATHCTIEKPDEFGTDMDGGGGVPAGFAVFFVIVAVLAIGGAIWRFSAVKRAATDAGLDERSATNLALLSDHGMETAVIAGAVRQSQDRDQSQDQAQDRPGATTAERLAALDDLRARGLVTEQEYSAKRQEILDTL